jgi:hypothetical protein
MYLVAQAFNINRYPGFLNNRLVKSRADFSDVPLSAHIGGATAGMSELNPDLTPKQPLAHW